MGAFPDTFDSIFLAQRRGGGAIATRELHIQEQNQLL
jgi:hypothetical protein